MGNSARFVNSLFALTLRIELGKDNLDNLQLSHRHCHDRKTAGDASLIRAVPMTKASQERSRMSWKPRSGTNTSPADSEDQVSP